jgi:RecB family exonuclease
MATRAARQELTLFWQRSDEKGRVQVRSPFLDRPGESIARRPGAKYAAAGIETLTPKEVAVRALLSTPGDAAGGERVVRAFGWDADTFAASAQFLRSIEDDRVPGPRDGVVGHLEGFWAPLAARGFSPTSLEAFSECRFKFFAHKALDLEALDSPEETFEFTPIETGQLYHAFLERFYKALTGLPSAASQGAAKEGRALPTTLADARRTFDACLAETVREFEATRTMMFPLLWEAERTRMRQVLEAFVAHDLSRRDGFVPTFFEEKVAGPLPLPLGRHANVNFMGYVDRLDVHPDGPFRVIDYKSNRSSRYKQSIEFGAIQTGKYLQAPIYFLLAGKLLRERGYTPDLDGSASGYEFLREYAQPGEDPELWLDGSFWHRGDEFADALAARLDGIEQGEFTIQEGSWCNWCDFANVCRRRHQPTRWRARRWRIQDPGSRIPHSAPQP